LKKIWAVVSYYDEEYYIMQSLISIAPFVDGFILVDGAYYGTKPTFSTDRTNELIGLFARTFGEGKTFKWYCSYDTFPTLIQFDFGLHKRITDKGWESEMEKRQFAIEQVPVGDWILIHDADELALGVPDLFRDEVSGRKDLSRHVISMESYGIGDWWHTPRVLKRTKKMSYQQNHWTILYGRKPHFGEPINKGYIHRYIMQLNMGDFYRKPRQTALKLESKDGRDKKENSANEIRDRMRKRILDAQRKIYEKEGYPINELIKHREKILGDEIWTKHYQTKTNAT